jgi:outer membrane immunogenic protein
MKRNGLCAIALSLIAGTAFSGTVRAADITEAAPAAFDWTGPYIGAHVGWGWVNIDGAYDTNDGTGDFVNDLSGNFDLDDDNILGGFQAGYNWQVNQWVFGIEGDISFTDWHSDLDNADDEKVSFDTDILVSLRARAGLAMDNLLLYATAGGAWTDTNFKASDGPGDNGDTDLNDLGFVVGGGAEYAFDEHWSVRAEGLYYLFDDKEDTSHLTSDSDAQDFIKLKDIAVARIGVNFRF